MPGNKARNSFSQGSNRKISKKKQSRSIITDEKDRSKTIVHTVLANRMDKIEDSLPVLLESYSDAISYVNEDGYLPLHAACIYYARNPRVIATLVKPLPKGIRTPVETRPSSGINIRRKYTGSYPIHIALYNGACLEVVKILLEGCTDMIHTPNKSGLCPLIIALKNRAEGDVIQYLISLDFHLVRNTDKRMNLPLHLACMYGCNADVITVLYHAYPCAVHRMNRDGLKPLDLAQRSRDFSDRAINLLLEAAQEEKKFDIFEVDTFKKSVSLTDD